MVNLSWAPLDSAPVWPATRQRRLQAGGCFRQGLCRKHSHWAMWREFNKGLRYRDMGGAWGNEPVEVEWPRGLVTTRVGGTGQAQAWRGKGRKQVQNMRKVCYGKLAWLEVRWKIPKPRLLLKSPADASSVADADQKPVALEPMHRSHRGWPSPNFFPTSTQSRLKSENSKYDGKDEAKGTEAETC